MRTIKTLIAYMLLLELLCLDHKFSFIIFNAGATEPTDSPDEFGNLWAFPGKLTQAGERQCYLSGLRDRDNLKSLSIKENYDREQVVAHSIGVESSEECLQSRFQGLFAQSEKNSPKIKETQKPLSTLNLGEISPALKTQIDDLKLECAGKFIQIMSYRNINSIRYYKVSSVEACPSFAGYYDNDTSSKELISSLKSFKKGNEEVLKSAFNLELQEDNASYNQILSLCENFKLNYTFGFDFQSFIAHGGNVDKFNADCKDLITRNYFYYLFSNYNKHFSSRLASTSVLRDLLNHLNSVKSQNEPSLKLIYFAADLDLISSMISVLFSTIDASSKVPLSSVKLDLSSEVRFSLIKQVKSMIEVYFDEELIFSMELNLFISNIESKLLSDDQIKNYCKWDTPKKPSVKPLLIVSIALIAALVLLVMVYCYLLYKDRKMAERKSKGQESFMTTNSEITA